MAGCSPRASLELQAATASAEAAHANPLHAYPQSYVLLDQHVIELPGGIDPSFLAALPDQLRREVVAEQFRVLGIDVRNRPVPVPTLLLPPASTPTTAQPPQPVVEQSQAASAGTATAGVQSAEINPEFLAALPPQIQQELLAQQRIEQQAREAAAAGTAQPSSSTAAAAAAGTSAVAIVAADEDDNASFMRALPASLRQAILFDMDHSQISALPEDLAAEARTLQQQHREREIDLFTAAAHRSAASRFGGGGAGGGSRGLRMGAHRTGGQAGLDGIYNVASSLLHDTYMYASGGGGGGGTTRDLSRLRRGLRQLGDADFIFNAPGGGLHGLSLTAGPSTQAGVSSQQAAAAAAAALERARNGRQLLDHESLACLLVLLFIDEPRMNMTKLHRVVRNLCIHGPTRAWVIRALLSILEKVSGKQELLMLEQEQQLALSTDKSGRSKQPMMGISSKSVTVATAQPAQPAWLTMVSSKFVIFFILLAKY
jgi:E3 ubiquitin-protein ligase HUWE1